ncbi:MAG: DUF899 domain-containing protein, partial [Bdellovibrionales bacterium]|nr:DUF899 domain-containing protein [Bdellovibrionales bacterium]
IVNREEWRLEIANLRKKEKELTRLNDQISAQRRRLPMYKIEKKYVFQTENGPKSLLELFDGRRQLIIYHFMFDPEWDKGCPGCSWVTDAMSHPAHLNARGVSMVIVSRASLDKIMTYKKQMGWTHPWVSSFESDFNLDFDATKHFGENHGISVLLRIGDEIYRTYFTEDRGVEHLGSHWTYLDLTPYGRKEDWEDSPEGWPQQKTYTLDQRHNEYTNDGREC